MGRREVKKVKEVREFRELSEVRDNYLVLNFPKLLNLLNFPNLPNLLNLLNLPNLLNLLNLPNLLKLSPPLISPYCILGRVIEGEYHILIMRARALA